MANKRRPGPRPAGHGDEPADPLGKLIDRYAIDPAGAMLVAGFLVVVGLGLAAGGWLVGSGWGQTALYVGGGFVGIVAVAVAGSAAANGGRSLEVRKWGLRYTDDGVVTEVRRDEITTVDVGRTDDTSYGLVSTHRRSSDTAGASGPLTHTAWDVTVRTPERKAIRLPPAYFHLEPNPKKLISQIRLRAGLRYQIGLIASSLPHAGDPPGYGLGWGGYRLPPTKPRGMASADPPPPQPVPGRVPREGGGRKTNHRELV